ncbi:hypothetical protein BDK51DRAFT_36611 [Blyttiomyces helicus]|uniref:Uncharacterized protein n=1 Tax=Blyttiomyces helicus TaxID=388810 RepID=A0A4P9W9U6_9FUNG|nr:hypothetical protein BDK51DRAFT_36611 [Blyttiomyces helicus]|eukprot:RKO88295.1 hypothetical protein BDK51DRAFT_36611 [Blyttiomyces helicus]
MISQNLELLQQFRETRYDESRTLEFMKKFKSSDPSVAADMKDFTNKTITLGFITHFRRMLLEAVSTAIDMIANEVGIIGRTDSSMAWGLTALGGDNSPWVHLPCLYAATIWHLAFEEGATYNILIDENAVADDRKLPFMCLLGVCPGLDNNGHCLAAAFDALSVHTNVMNKDDISGIVACQQEFVNTAAALLIRLRQRGNERDLMAKNVDPALLVLKRFAEDSKYVSSDAAEGSLPYALLHVIAGDMYRKRVETALLTKRAPASMAAAAAAVADEEAAF